METTDWVTLGVGIFASTIALTALSWNIIRERPKIRLKVLLWGDPKIAVSMQVIVFNTGKYGVSIYGVGYTTYSNDEISFYPIHYNLPKTIRPGEQDTFMEDFDVLEKFHLDTRIKYAWIQDGTDRRYRCKIPIYWK